jgi:hypothetical protein
MTDAVEVVIESALLDRYNAFSYGSPDILFLAQPNVSMTPPAASSQAYWLRATFLPATTVELGIDYGSSNQHQGIFQIDVFFGQDSGELKAVRLATNVISWFKRGTKMTKSGFSVEVVKAPYRSRMIKDDPWIIIPVSIPYLAFAANPA